MQSKQNKASRGVRAYFLGSGEIGVPSLEALIQADEIELAGVGTQPDRPAGRRRELHATPIAAAAERSGITPDKPASVNSESFLSRLRMLLVDIVIVMAFGQILKSDLLTLPPCGCLNIHASLLPRHRGASPIQSAILAGDIETGVSFMKMDEGLDTGPVFEMHRVAVSTEETAATLENKLAALAANHVCDCVKRVALDDPEPVPQDDSQATRAPKLKKSDGQINWKEPADLIERKIRAYTPWPRAYFVVKTGKKERRIQIAQAFADARTPVDAQPGEILQADKNDWVIACGEGSLHLQKVIPSGKDEMTAPEFLRGTQLEAGTVV